MIPARIYGSPEDCFSEEGGEIEFNVMDRKGYSAAWLEKKLTPEDVSRIYDEYVAALEESK